MQTYQLETLLATFIAMQQATDALCAQLKIDGLPHWIADESNLSFNNDLTKLIYTLKKLTPASDSVAPQETYACPGAVAVTPETFKLVQCVNTTKQAFKAEVLQAQQTLGHQTSKIIRELLIRHGHGLVKLMQAYRHLHVIDFQPRRIAWSMGANSTNVILSKVQARDLLLKIGQGTHIDIQLAKLDLLATDESLVIKRSLKANWVVNISTAKNDDRSTLYNLRTSLPVFYRCSPELPLPDVCFSTKMARSKPRADKLLDDEPFLPSIHAFRYKNATE